MQSSIHHFTVRNAGRLALGAATLLLSTGCITHPRVVSVHDTQETAYDGRILGHYQYPIGEDVSGGGKELITSSGSPHSLTHVSDVRTADVVTAQRVGAYVDPVNPNLLHEPHIVMRRDQSSRWRLAPATSNPELLHGPVAGLRRAENKPGATNGEVGRELMASRRAMEATQQAVGEMYEKDKSMADQSNANQSKIVENQKKLLEYQDAIAKRVKDVETRQQQRESVPGGAGQRINLNTTGSSEDGKQPAPPMTQPQTVNRSTEKADGTRSGVYDGGAER